MGVLIMEDGRNRIIEANTSSGVNIISFGAVRETVSSEIFTATRCNQK